MFAPNYTNDLLVGLSSDRRQVLGIIDYRHCYLAVSPLKVEIIEYIFLYFGPASVTI